MDNYDRNEHDELISKAKALTEKLKLMVDNHKNLKAIEGTDELTHKWADLFFDYNAYEEKLRMTICTSKCVYENFLNLGITMQVVEKFLTDLSNVKTLFFTKSKIKKRLQKIVQALRAKNMHLLTSVTLELLSQDNKLDHSNDNIMVPEFNTVEYNVGFAHYHGICRPKNYTIAVEMFKEAAMKGDAEAMLMLSECYSAASGLEKDEHMSSEWLERAAELRCPGALYKKAMRILRDLEFSPDKVRKLLCNFDDTYESGFGDTTPGSEVDQLSSPSRSSRGRAMSACPLMRSRTEGQLHGNSSDSHRNRDRSTEREIEMNMRSSQVRQSRETMIDRDEEDEENFQHAMQLLRESAERGFVAAKTDLGNMFELAADEESAFRWFEVASSVGCPKAMNKLGLLYFHGKGTAQDLERAFSLFTSAAKAGDKDANNNAGSCLEQGLGTEMRHAAALTYYLKGAEMDSTPAMYSLGYLLIRSSVKSLEDLKVAREMHSAHSLTHTDEWDRHGRYASRDRFNGRHSMDADQGLEGTAKTRLGSSMAGVSASYAGIASVDIFSSSREQEKKGKKPPRPLSVPHNSNTFNNTQRSTTSQRNNSSNSRPVSLSKSASHTLSLSLANAPRLNDTYSSAQTAIDSLESQQEKAEAQVKEGVRWLRAAAEKGMMDARYQLGLVYQQGIGCPSDISSALSQYQYAARGGHAKAALVSANILYDNLMKDMLPQDGPPDAITEARYRNVMELYRVAADGGIADAMNSLGLLLEDGRGCSGQQPDAQAAASWYMEAALKGKCDAAVNLALLLSMGAVNGTILSVDSTQRYTMSDAVQWLEDYRAETPIPHSVRSQLDALLHQLNINLKSSNRGTPRGSSQHHHDFDDSPRSSQGYANGALADPQSPASVRSVESRTLRDYDSETDGKENRRNRNDSRDWDRERFNDRGRERGSDRNRRISN